MAQFIFNFPLKKLIPKKFIFFENHVFGENAPSGRGRGAAGHLPNGRLFVRSIVRSEDAVGGGVGNKICDFSSFFIFNFGSSESPPPPSGGGGEEKPRTGEKMTRLSGEGGVTT